MLHTMLVELITTLSKQETNGEPTVVNWKDGKRLEAKITREDQVDLSRQRAKNA